MKHKSKSRPRERFIENGQGADPSFIFRGEWTIHHAAAIEQDIGASPEDPYENASVDAGGIEKLDTAGAWLIRRYFPGARFSHLSTQHQALLDFLPEGVEEPPEERRRSGLITGIVRIGKKTAEAFGFLYAVFSFIGDIFIRFFANFLHPHRFRLPSIVRHIQETGLQALPIISLLACGISMVIFYQGATQLQRFGADIYTIDLTVISLLREMAVLTTAIMVAGRSGSAFAAEIGVMKLRGEVDALRTIGMDPVETLVLPRLLALLITLPLLAFLADIVGLAGGGVMAFLKLKMSFSSYIDRVQGIATPTMFFIGLIKAPVFALLITTVCTYQGMNVSGSAENVGKLTTLAVVQSIFLVIMADAVFSILFSKVGI